MGSLSKRRCQKWLLMLRVRNSTILVVLSCSLIVCFLLSYTAIHIQDSTLSDIDTKYWDSQAWLLEDSNPASKNLPHHDFKGSTPHKQALKYLLEEKNLCKDHPDLEILAYIHSSPGKVQNRDLIRRTWGNLRYFPEVKMIVIFIFGAPKDEEEKKQIENESKLHRDIVQLDFHDSYKNLSYKGVGALQWITENCRNPNWILKSDDDMVINIFGLSAYLKYYTHSLAYTQNENKKSNHNNENQKSIQNSNENQKSNHNNNENQKSNHNNNENQKSNRNQEVDPNQNSKPRLEPNHKQSENNLEQPESNKPSENNLKQSETNPKLSESRKQLDANPGEDSKHIRNLNMEETGLNYAKVGLRHILEDSRTRLEETNPKDVRIWSKQDSNMDETGSNHAIVGLRHILADTSLDMNETNSNDDQRGLRQASNMDEAGSRHILGYSSLNMNETNSNDVRIWTKHDSNMDEAAETRVNHLRAGSRHILADSSLDFNMRPNRILCAVWYGMPVLRGKGCAKWCVTEEEWPDKTFPTYCSGSAFVIPNKLIPSLYDAYFHSPFLWVDDAYISGVLPRQAGIRHQPIYSLYELNHNLIERNLVQGNRIFCHHPGNADKRAKWWNLIAAKEGW